ncbi:uncharacterized protein BJ212DRAFT_48267 [Suillus subaureus]|uniref:Glucosamine 6-phosphate N-acetyltransferase n=1 Tax=Suillus subaureus TaxID=48587 RepID=A0A9P7JKA2_9AGAM|nr:uncharacterized protein BJ212DRAFT_48267 [Suillus subaureus]KAG1827366.1 hypothetical protein BJ212DRAFT_48267 [Suillus subaureus]
MRTTPSAYFSIVILDEASNKIVGVGTVIIEGMFLRGLSSVGHIEDIAVDKSQQGNKLGLRIILALADISESSGCSKTIPNCNDADIREFHPTIDFRLYPTAFYQKRGYVRMRMRCVKHGFL